LRAVVVLREGAIVAERYYNGETAETLHDIRSAGKSITALLVGTAVARGQLATTKTVGDYWPEVVGRPAATKPGSTYRYNSLGSYIAGRVVENASGADLEDYAARVLFAPLGITRWSWDRDVAKHPKGQGNLAPRVAIGAVDRYADSYGYFWYAKTQDIGGRKIAVHFASGNGGNKIYVIPARRMVVSIASSAYGKGYGQRRSEDILKAILKADATQM
jgi:CubicO group peptidase (beta-lactamase class C family)